MISTVLPDVFGPALVRAAGGDAQLIDLYRQLAWDAYLAAGTPCGPDEAGMAAWWSGRLAAAVN